MEKEDPPPSSGADSLSPRGRRLFFDLRFAGGRMLVAGATGILATLLTSSDLPFRVRAIVGWDAGALVFAVLAWLMILRATPASTRARAALEDPGRRLAFVLALLASLFSLFAAIVVFHELKSLAAERVAIWTGLALTAVGLSWIVTHTVFTLRYAHLYYRRRGATGCLDFPGNEAPSDLDFAYFAFTIGMCFQVSDVVIKTSAARRVVLVHALMSFVYNTTILAISLNLVTTLLA